MFTVLIYSYNPTTADLKIIDDVCLDKKLNHEAFLVEYKHKVKRLTTEHGSILIDTSYKN
jgi:hypothetical protein